MSLQLAPSLRRCLARTLPTPAASLQHLRGKKKLAKVPTISVRLTQDVPKYGRKGSIVPVSRGRMRNIWYGRNMAEYMSAAELKAAPKSDILLERDITFRPDLPAAPVEIELNTLTPTKTISLLESYLPPTLSFSRAVTATSDSAIQGSISTSDVAGAVRAIANAHGEEGARVVLGAENVRFLGGEEKLKALGEYQVEIAVKGAPVSVRRAVVVEREESHGEL